MPTSIATRPRLRAVPKIFATADFQEELKFLPAYRLLPIFFQAFLTSLMRPLFYIFGRIEVKGLENIKNIPHGLIFASNHLSELDPVIIGSMLPFFSPLRPLFYTSLERKQYVHNPAFSWRGYFYGGILFKLFGAYPVIVGIRNYEQSLAAHIKLIDEGRSVVIFPEGKRTYDGDVKQAKGGVAYLAYRTNAPIVPVSIEGVFKTTPREFFTFKRKIKISFGKPFFPIDILPSRESGEVDIHDFHIAAQEVMKKIKELQ